MAYQSNKKKDIEHIANVNDYFNIAIPDYIFHLDVSFETYSKRKAKRLNERQLDELEKKGDKFFKKNIEMYKEVYMYLEDLEYISNCLGENIKIPNIIYIDSNESIDTTKKEIIPNLNKIFN
jgi:thymidylate kinase